MRKGLVVGAVAIGLLAAGCGTGAGAPSTTGGAPTAPPTSVTNKSQRTGPTKSLNLADKCSIVTQQQWQALGANTAPRARVSVGDSGCNYAKGQSGESGSWSIFVAASPGTTFQQEAGQRATPNHSGQLDGGYPFADYAVTTGCVLFADVSDQGHLITNIARDSPDNPGFDLCQQAEKFAQAAIQNLPNA